MYFCSLVCCSISWTESSWCCRPSTCAGPSISPTLCTRRVFFCLLTRVACLSLLPGSRIKIGFQVRGLDVFAHAKRGTSRFPDVVFAECDVLFFLTVFVTTCLARCRLRSSYCVLVQYCLQPRASQTTQSCALLRVRTLPSMWFH